MMYRKSPRVPKQIVFLVGICGVSRASLHKEPKVEVDLYMVLGVVQSESITTPISMSYAAVLGP
jgi:hypothetical protein